MTPATKVIIGIVILAVLTLGGALALNKKSTITDSNQTTATSSTTSAAPVKTPSAASAATITYMSTGFQPAVTNVKVGSTVTIKNADSEAMQMDSDPHPAHTDEPELNVGVVKSGESKTFTVTKAGTWGIHNHLSPGETGKIVAQ